MTKKQFADLFDESERRLSERSGIQIRFLSIIYSSFDTTVLIVSTSIQDSEECLYCDDNNKDPLAKQSRLRPTTISSRYGPHIYLPIAITLDNQTSTRWERCSKETELRQVCYGIRKDIIPNLSIPAEEFSGNYQAQMHIYGFK